jgi:hypothetical protein
VEVKVKPTEGEAQPEPTHESGRARNWSMMRGLA